MLFFFVCWRGLQKCSIKNNGYIKIILLKKSHRRNQLRQWDPTEIVSDMNVGNMNKGPVI